MSYQHILAIKGEAKVALLLMTVSSVALGVVAMPERSLRPPPQAIYDVTLENEGPRNIASPAPLGRIGKASKHRIARKPSRKRGSDAPEAQAILTSATASEDCAVTGHASTEKSGLVGSGLGSGESSPGSGGGGGLPSGGAKIVDYSKPRPRSRVWNCNWPLTDTRDAIVYVRVSVNKKGQAERVHIVRATHREFVSDAYECALNSAYIPAKSENGEAIDAVSDEWPIHFFKSESTVY